MDKRAMVTVFLGFGAWSFEKSTNFIHYSRNAIKHKLGGNVRRRCMNQIAFFSEMAHAKILKLSAFERGGSCLSNALNFKLIHTLLTKLQFQH